MFELLNAQWLAEYRQRSQSKTLSIEYLQSLQLYLVKLLETIKQAKLNLQQEHARANKEELDATISELQKRICTLEIGVLVNQQYIIQVIQQIISFQLYKLAEDCFNELGDIAVHSPVPSPELNPALLVFSQAAQEITELDLEHVAVHSLASDSRPPSPVTASDPDEIEFPLELHEEKGGSAEATRINAGSSALHGALHGDEISGLPEAICSSYRTGPKSSKIRKTRGSLPSRRSLRLVQLEADDRKSRVAKKHKFS